jgi:hypothetical protein
MQNRIQRTVFLSLAYVVTIAFALAPIGPNPALIPINIHTQQPAIQNLLQIVQILRHPFCGVTRIVLRHLIRPTVVASETCNCIVSCSFELVHEIFRARIDVFGYVVCALSVGVILAGDLHQARCGPALTGVAGGLLHRDHGQEDWVDIVFRSALLESPVVLFASGADFGVECLYIDVDEVVEVQEGWFPARIFEAGVEPRFGAVFQWLTVL